MSYEDRKSTLNSGVRKAIRRGSAEEEVRKQAFWQKSGNDRAFFLVGCVKKSRAARF